MPPVNRNQPKRAASSESSYSLMEFMREFPDDAACLEWLWRKRYAPDGEHAVCPKCGIERRFRDSRAARVMAPTTDALLDFIGRATCGLPLLEETPA